MSSFISVLSCLILVLASSVFTLPVQHTPSSTTQSSLNHDVTTDHAFNLRLVSDDETTPLSKIMTKPSLNKHMAIETTTSLDSLSTENAIRDARMFDENMIFKQFSSTTTVKPMTQTEEVAQRGLTDDMENKHETKINKDEMNVESTTHNMLSSSSTIVPQFHLSETSTKKYIGHLNDHEEEEEEVTKPTKSRTSQPKKVKDETEDKLGKTTYPTAVYVDQNTFKLPKLRNEYLRFDDSNHFVVTDHSIILSSTTPKEDKEEKLPLHQGEESTLNKTKKSDN